MADCYIKWKEWGAIDFGRTRLEDAVYFAAELGASGITSVRGLKIGELGFGNGAFAGWARRGGAHWTGQELIPELRERAIREGYEVLAPNFRFSTCGSGAFDLIVAIDVMEHLELEEIRNVLLDARHALKSGGIFLARIPSGDSPFSGAIYHSDVTHRSLLGSGAVRQLAQETGFEVAQIRSPALPLSGLGLIRAVRRAGVGAMQRVAFTFVRYALMGDKAAILSPNMVVVLRSKAVST